MVRALAFELRVRWFNPQLAQLNFSQLTRLVEMGT